MILRARGSFHRMYRLSRATDSQIKRAYHKLAMVHHPDKRTSNPEGSDEAFKEIGYAYQVVCEGAVDFYFVSWS